MYHVAQRGRAGRAGSAVAQLVGPLGGPGQPFDEDLEEALVVVVPGARLGGAAGRDDLSSKEQAEVKIIQQYLPQALSAEEIETIINDAISSTGAASIKDMGKVMGIVKPKVTGRGDMGEVSGKIKALLQS